MRSSKLSIFIFSLTLFLALGFQTAWAQVDTGTVSELLPAYLCLHEETRPASTLWGVIERVALARFEKNPKLVEASNEN